MSAFNCSVNVPSDDIVAVLEQAGVEVVECDRQRRMIMPHSNLLLGVKYCSPYISDGAIAQRALKDNPEWGAALVVVGGRNVNVFCRTHENEQVIQEALNRVGCRMEPCTYGSMHVLRCDYRVESDAVIAAPREAGVEVIEE